MQSIQTRQIEQTVTLSSDTVLVHTPFCTVREQDEQHLIYNTKTDEMYLIPKTGAYIYELCDGLATINDIEDVFFRILSDNKSTIKTQLTGFLEKLIERGILTIESHV